MFYQNVGTPVRSSTGYLALIAVILFLVGMGISWYDRREKDAPSVSKADREQQVRRQAVTPVCTAAQPCTLTKGTDGSTEKVMVDPGKLVCFEPSIWRDLKRLGYTTSYRGGPENKYICTREEVITGTCRQDIFDAFWFTPEAGMDAPKYWFVSEGSRTC